MNNPESLMGDHAMAHLAHAKHKGICKKAWMAAALFLAVTPSHANSLLSSTPIMQQQSHLEAGEKHPVEDVKPFWSSRCYATAYDVTGWKADDPIPPLGFNMTVIGIMEPISINGQEFISEYFDIRDQGPEEGDDTAYIWTEAANAVAALWGVDDFGQMVAKNTRKNRSMVVEAHFRKDDSATIKVVFMDRGDKEEEDWKNANYISCDNTEVPAPVSEESDDGAGKYSSIKGNKGIAGEGAPADCLLEVDGKSFINGPCDFTAMSTVSGEPASSFQIYTPSYFAQVNVTSPGRAVG